ncbi:amino acid ABC transporter [Tamilnaduibacter salinus]|uniref:Amino acid ABC transporter n=1 Tax=Tamilnaduibacter salinus TaxID=1484056 RepID=A0A2A2I7R6_9GAMM|nr:transporter substrate-binding domain-containing protein [Tamilnaduibacter salinus]PAV27083.1 amino acid ABC transporter [Tamilnaduibacter salinus]
MITFARQLPALSCLLFLLGVITPASEADTAFRVAYENKTQFPYYMGNTSKVLDQPGAAVELVGLLEEEVPGLQVRFSRYPWKRCLALLEAGAVDAIFNASFNEARMAIGAYPWKDEAVDPSRRLTTIGYYLYTREGADVGWDGEAFADTSLKVGAPLGYSIVRDLEKLGLSVTNAESSLQNLFMLAADRVEAVALQSVTGDFLLTKYGDRLNNIARIEPPIKTKPYYLMLSHRFQDRHPALSEQIWDAVAELRKTRLQSLAQQYME